MLPLSELVGFAATLDERGHSEVADAVAARWGHPPGSARFRRSSASHVFVVPRPDAAEGRAFLRFLPEPWREHGRQAAVAEIMHGYARRGLAVASPLRSLAGELVETVATPRGAVHAMLVEAAPGEQVDQVPVPWARAWGEALARLHRHPIGDLGDRLPETFAPLRRAAQLWAGDPPLAHAVARLSAALDRLPANPDDRGVIHGDFELDNLAWRGGVGTAYDFDEAGRSWYAADIAYVLEEVDEVTAAAFLDGYRSHRRLLSTVELSWLPLLRVAWAARWLVDVPAIVDHEPVEGEPRWLVALRIKLAVKARRHRELVLREVRG